MQEILAADSLVHSMLVELLLPRLCVYYRAEDNVPPLALDKCAALQVICCTEPEGLLLPSAWRVIG